MKLLVRLDSLAHPRTGIGRYAESLLRQILAQENSIKISGAYHGRLIPADELELLLDDRDGRESGGEYLSLFSMGSIKAMVRSIPGAYAFRQRLQQKKFLRALNENPDIYHELSHAPLDVSAPLVLTIHDMSHARFPEFHPRERVAYISSSIGQSIKRADHVIAVSKFTHDEICSLYPEVESKVSTVYLGVSPEFRPLSSDEIAPLIRRWDLAYSAYILSVATLEPRKNLVGLLRSYFSLPAEISRFRPLVLVGAKGWKNRELESLLASHESPDHRVILTGYVSQRELVALMAGAGLFVYASLYEGFGLPVVEAMACGVPVLTSDRGAMKEVAGDLATLVDPLEFREELLLAMLERPRIPDPVEIRGRFSWDKTAAETLEIYKSLIC